jgi:hypothetical protein
MRKRHFSGAVYSEICFVSQARKEKCIYSMYIRMAKSLFTEYPHCPAIFLDGKVDNNVHLALVKLEPAQAGICDIEVLQQAKIFRFTIEEDLLCIM